MESDRPLEAWRQDVQNLPTVVFFALTIILPLLGAPLSIFLLAVGVRYGLIAGLAVTAIIILVQHAIVFVLTHSSLKPFLERLMSRWKGVMPSVQTPRAVPFYIIFSLTPGPPFWLKLYFLAFTEKRMIHYMGLGVVLHVLQAVPFVGLGAAAFDLNKWWFAGFGMLAVVLFFGERWLRRRLMARERQIAEPAEEVSAGETERE